ncbi:MAG: SDR family oxidoreductase [Micromonosporaceae bacterium]|nr:SDR family oxidoreductase [Micromonosporaceae bacterium]
MTLAVVSGGGTGIGAATARGLLSDGYDVVIIGRRAEVLAATAARLGEQTGRPGAIRTVVADLRRPDEVARAVSELGEGDVDVLVNNAGAFVSRTGPSLSDVDAYWRASLDVNVMTAVLLTEALLDRLTRPGGTLVFISSIAAQRGGAGAYSAAKAALHGWAYDLAAELGPAGVTVNVVSPGYVEGTEFFAGRMTPEGHAARVARTMVGRAGTPDEIADAIRYLTRARYVTGQIIGVNGGAVLGR